jgi:acetoin:2,6-dichlorophenolindophenol oxidoreductase subunit alpha
MRRMTLEDLVQAYEAMCVGRRFEELVGEAVSSGEIHGEMHLGIGHEAVGAVLARHLRRGDAIVSTHRPHLHALAAGVDPVLMLGEILERDALNRGKGGHMHLFDPRVDFMCTGIVGASAPIAAGYAIAQSLAGDGNLTVSVVGDGAMNEGAVFETMNLAVVRRLPIVFLCEDNAYSISVPKHDSTAGELHRRGDALGIAGFPCDGTEVHELDTAMDAAFSRTRSERLPTLIVANVYRFRGHYEGDLDLYRPAAEKEEQMRKRDPLSKLRARLLSSGVSEEQLGKIESRASDTVKSWASAARDLPYPFPATAHEGVYSSG